MRILVTADPEIPVPPRHYGGIERIVAMLLQALGERGHTVGLTAHPDSRSPVSHFYPWPGVHSRGIGNTVINMLALQHTVAAFKPDVLHSFSRLMYMVPLLPLPLPKVMSYQRHAGGWQTGIAARLGGRSLRFTGCSEFTCTQGRPAGGTWQAIHNFVDVKKYTFVPSVPADAPLVYLGRIESIKGADLAIDIARASGRRLILAGNHANTGPERSFWEHKIAPRLDHQGIEWIGEVDDVQKNALLGRAAALLVPIQWNEPFGIVFVEALACGTPVISCPRGALPEIVRHGTDGFLVSNKTEACAAVSRVHTLARAECRRRVETSFSVDVITADYEQLYLELVGSTS